MVDDAKIVSKFLPSSITFTHVPTIELFIKCVMTHKTTGIEDRHMRTGMLMTTNIACIAWAALHSGLAFLRNPSFAELRSFVFLHEPSSICLEYCKTK